MMDENRPALCRNRLKDEGKPHPRSGCNVCRNGGMMGCPHERAEAKDHSAPTRGEVTQGDREAAASLTDFLHSGEAPKAVARIRDGSLDHTRIVQAFAAHRLAAIEECAKAIADLPTGRTEEVMEGHEDAYRAIERLRNLGRGV